MLPISCLALHPHIGYGDQWTLIPRIRQELIIPSARHILAGTASTDQMHTCKACACVCNWVILSVILALISAVISDVLALWESRD